MPGFNVLSTNHTSFTVSSLDRTVALFRDALGFEVTSKAPRDPAAIERITGVEGCEVMIAYVRGPGHGFSPRGSVHCVDQGPNAGARGVHLADGDGITVEFIEPVR